MNLPNAIRLPLLSGLFVCLAVAPAQAATDDTELSDYVARLQYAWFVGDHLTAVEIAGLLAAERPRGDIEHWLRYYSAYGYYRAAQIADEDYLDEYVDRCDEQARAALKLRSEFSEALIVRGACAALLAERRPIAAVLAPSRALRALDRAALLDPENPRLKLVQAQASLGRKALAEELPPPAVALAQAIDGFQRFHDASVLTPDWGEAEAHVIRGRLALAAGDRLGARDAAEQALGIAPDYTAAIDFLTSLRAAR